MKPKRIYRAAGISMLVLLANTLVAQAEKSGADSLYYQKRTQFVGYPPYRLAESDRSTLTSIRDLRQAWRIVSYVYEDITPEAALAKAKEFKAKIFKPWVAGEIQLLSLGGIYFVGLPGEIMCEIGFAIKKYFRPEKSFVAAYANGCIGYIPTPQALIEGGYEPNDSIKAFDLPSRFSPKVQSVIKQTVENLHEKI